MVAAAADPSRCLVLFAHGARDLRWAESITRIRDLVAARVDATTHVRQAYLELMSPSLPELAAELAAKGVTEIKVIPIFLGQGAHVRDALPKLIQQLQATYPAMHITLAATIGESDHVLQAIAHACLVA